MWLWGKQYFILCWVNKFGLIFFCSHSHSIIELIFKNFYSIFIPFYSNNRDTFFPVYDFSTKTTERTLDWTFYINLYFFFKFNFQPDFTWCERIAWNIWVWFTYHNRNHLLWFPNDFIMRIKPFMVSFLTTSAC